MSDWYKKHEKDVAAAIKKAKEADREKALVCIFAKMKDNTHCICTHIMANKAELMGKEAKTEGGKIISTGVLFRGEGGLTFEVSSGSVAVKALFVKAATAVVGSQVNAVVIASPDSKNLESPSPEEEAEDNGQPDGKAAFAERLKSLIALVQKANSPTLAQEAKVRLGEANGHASKQEFEQANALLDQLEKQLSAKPAPASAQATSATPTKAAPPAPPAPPAQASTDSKGDGVAAFSERVKAIIVRVQQAGDAKLAEQAKQQITEAQGLVRNKEFGKAGEILNRLEASLPKGAATAKAPEKGQTEKGHSDVGGISVMKLGKARVEWISIRTIAIKEIKRIQFALQREFMDDHEQQQQLDKALSRLDKISADLNENLDEQLDQVLNAQTESDRQKLAAAAKTSLASLVQLIENDPIVANMDGNEILPDTKIVAPMRAKLAEIAAALGTAKA